MLPATVETDRLRLQPRTAEYVDPLTVYDHCKRDAPHIDEITEHLPWNPHDHPKESLAFLQRGAEMREELTGAEFVVRPKDGEDRAGEVAGFTGLTFEWDRDLAELGCWFRKPFWGRGYSGERALALAELAFEGLDIEMLAAEHYVGNENSASAITDYIDRLGGRREGVIRNAGVADLDDGGAVDLVRYTVSQAEYRDADPEQTVAFYDEAGEPWP